MPGTGKKMLMWLGLADAEEYDDYEPYDEMPAPQVASVRRGGEPFETVSSGSSGSSGSPAVRTLPRRGRTRPPPSTCGWPRPICARYRPRHRRPECTWLRRLSSPTLRRSRTGSALANPS